MAEAPIRIGSGVGWGVVEVEKFGVESSKFKS